MKISCAIYCITKIMYCTHRHRSCTEPFLPRDCLLPVCSTYTKRSTREVLQPLNKVARVKYWIFFKSILISILIDHYPVSLLGQTPLDPWPPPRLLEERKTVTTAVLQDFAYEFNLLVCGDATCCKLPNPLRPSSRAQPPPEPPNLPPRPLAPC